MLVIDGIALNRKNICWRIFRYQNWSAEGLSQKVQPQIRLLAKHASICHGSHMQEVACCVGKWLVWYCPSSKWWQYVYWMKRWDVSMGGTNNDGFFLLLYGTWPHQCKPIHHRTFCGSKSFQLREGLLCLRGRIWSWNFNDGVHHGRWCCCCCCLSSTAKCLQQRMSNSWSSLLGKQKWAALCAPVVYLAPLTTSTSTRSTWTCVQLQAFCISVAICKFSLYIQYIFVCSICSAPTSIYVHTILMKPTMIRIVFACCLILYLRLAVNELRRAEAGSLCIFALCCASFSRMCLGV